MPKRIFTYEEATALMPVVRQLTIDAAERIEGMESEDPADYQRVIGEWADAVTAHGIEVKGLWLIDFDNGAGYYCWKYPEPALEHFHGYHEGFGRRVKLN